MEGVGNREFGGVKGLRQLVLSPYPRSMHVLRVTYLRSMGETCGVLLQELHMFIVRVVRVPWGESQAAPRQSVKRAVQILKFSPSSEASVMKAKFLTFRQIPLPIVGSIWRKDRFRVSFLPFSLAGFSGCALSSLTLLGIVALPRLASLFALRLLTVVVGRRIRKSARDGRVIAFDRCSSQRFPGYSFDRGGGAVGWSSAGCAQSLVRQQHLEVPNFAALGALRVGYFAIIDQRLDRLDAIPRVIPKPLPVQQPCHLGLKLGCDICHSCERRSG